MKRFIHTMVIAIALVVAILLIGGPASAQLIPPGPGPGPTSAPSGATALTSGPGDKMYPAISGNTVVWLDNSTRSVQVCDVASGQSLTIAGNDSSAVVFMRQVDISGNSVVWTGMNAATGASDIYLYDTAKGSVTPLTNDPAYQAFPSVSDNFVCWVDLDMETEKGQIHWCSTDAGDSELIKFATSELSSPQTGSTASNQLYPAVGGETLAWLDDEGNASGHLNLNWFAGARKDWVVFDSTTTPISPPAVSSDGRLIVWVVEAKGSSVLLMADTVAREVTSITGTEAMPANPAVDGNYIVWTDNRNGNGDIYLYDIQSGQERQITSDSTEQAFPDISGNRIVWMGQDTGQWEIYEMEVTGTPVPPAPGPSAPVPPAPGPSAPVPPAPGPSAPVPPAPVPPAPGPSAPVPPAPGPSAPVPPAPGPSDGLTITGDDIANLQWQEDPAMPGWLTARDPARGLTFYVDPDIPDIIIIITDSGEWYGYSSTTGLVSLDV
ncbi:MAG: hypothetical protein GYA64_00580 [Methanomicrobiales archaeon]|nr:hypothetical protein [Methanomicrobiales archaeon]